MLTMRRSLRRAWQLVSWPMPLSFHITLALATGVACAIAASRYSMAMSSLYAAIFGTFVGYPAMVAIWWHFNRSGGRGR